jgi:ABC-2 type transport system permease protein
VAMAEALPTPVVPELREIRGPSAFGGDTRRFFDLLWMVSVTEFRSQYANTALGFLWTLIRPLIFFGVIFLVLRGVLRFGANIEDYGLILVVGLILFSYFQEVTTRSVRSVASKEGMVRKMQFPRIVIPLSVSLSGAFTLILNFAALFPLMMLFGLDVQPQWALFPLLLVALIVLTTALSMILSVLFVRFEDTGQAWGLISRVLFYATPVLFPIETFDNVPQAVQSAIAASPLALIVEQARVWLIDSDAPNGVSEAGVFFGLIVPVVLGLAICVFAMWIFQRDAPRVAEAL